MLTVLATLSSVIQTVVVLYGIYFAVTTVKQNDKSRNVETIKTVFEGFSTPEAYRERHAILSLGPVEPLGLDEDGYLLYMRNCDFYQRLGFLARHEFISVDYVIKMYSGTIISIWGCVLPFIDYMREVKGLTNYSTDFEWLYKNSLTYRAANFPDEELSFSTKQAIG